MVVDGTPPTASPLTSADSDVLSSPSDDPEVFVLRAVKDDPFVTIAEIRRDYERQIGESLGWWRVFGVLRRHRLVRRKSRFRYAWGRS